MATKWWLKPIPGASSGSSSGRDFLTDAPEAPRIKIGPAVDHLEREILHMYWAGVERELPHLLLTLRRWQTRDEHSKTVLPDEEDLHIYGYDTFLDQVSHSSREFSRRYRRMPEDEENALKQKRKKAKGAKKKKQDEESPNEEPPPPSYAEALESRGWDIFSQMQSKAIRGSIRESLEEIEMEELNIPLRRSRMLLQSAQFLDITKVIEYREPEKSLPFWKQKSPSQLTPAAKDDSNMPILSSMICTSCRNAIRESLFRHIKTQDIVICETCYRESHFGDPTYTKVYKQCCLAKVVTTNDSQQICTCIGVERRDCNGRLKNLFLIDNSKGNPGHVNIKGNPGYF